MGTTTVRMPTPRDPRIDSARYDHHFWADWIHDRPEGDEARLIAISTLVSTYFDLIEKSNGARRRGPRAGKGARKAEWVAEGASAGKGARKAAWVAEGASWAYQMAAAMMLERFSLLLWPEACTYITTRDRVLLGTESGRRAYFEPYAIEQLCKARDMIGRIGWVFALQRLLGKENKMGDKAVAYERVRSYMDDDSNFESPTIEEMKVAKEHAEQIGDTDVAGFAQAVINGEKGQKGG